MSFSIQHGVVRGHSRGRGRVLVAPIVSLACMAVAACSSDAPGPSDVIESDDGRSFADTLMFVVAVKDGGASSPRYLDAANVHRIQLSVDGREWGTYTVTPEEATPQTFRYHDAVQERLVVAVLSEREDVEDQELPRAGDWVDFLDSHLAPGGHVAEVRRVWLRAGDNTVEVQLNEMVPFNLEHGYYSAMIGRVEFEAPGLEEL